METADLMYAWLKKICLKLYWVTKPAYAIEVRRGGGPHRLLGYDRGLVHVQVGELVLRAVVAGVVVPVDGLGSE